MRTITAFASLVFAISSLAADQPIAWVNGDNPTATPAWHTIVYIGTSPNVGPTNSVTTVTVNWPTTTVTVTGLQAGTKYYFSVAHTDMEDLSDLSNEVMKKTKINPPHNTTAP